MFNAVAEYLGNNYKSLSFPDDIVRYVYSAELSEITVKIIYVNDLPGMKINFDVLVDCEIDFAEKSSRDDRYDQCNMWFKIACSGDLSCSLNDFRIRYVSTYDYKDKQLKPLSDALVPYIKTEEMDDVAKDFLQRYYPEALKAPTSINPMILSERMGLSVELKNITDDFSVFGQIYFADCEAEHYNKATNLFEKTAVAAGTIFVDPDAYFLRNLGSVNNTIIHECVHWDKHRIIEKLVSSGFAERKGKSLIPTQDGINLIKVLPEALTSPLLTAEWEQRLSEIANGSADPDTFMRDIESMAKGLCVKYYRADENVQKLFTPQKEPVGVCPRCGEQVYEGKKNFYCGNRGCGFVLWKNDRFWLSRKKELTKKMAADLLKKGRVKVKGMYSEKKESTYDATVIMDDTGGKYVNFKLEFEKRKERANER